MSRNVGDGLFIFADRLQRSRKFSSCLAYIEMLDGVNDPADSASKTTGVMREEELRLSSQPYKVR